MSHRDHPNHGRPFRSNPTGGDSHSGSSYSEQMALADPHQANDFHRDPYSHSIPHQPHFQNVPHAPTNGHREDIPPPVRGVAGPGRAQEPLHFDVAYQGIVDYIPQPLVGNPPYVFPEVGHVQGIPAQAQFNDPVNLGLERNPFDYVPQHIAQGPVYGAFPHPFVHRVPTPNQGGAENLRRLAIRYLYHPNAQVGMVSMEAGVAGRCKVVIVLESHDIF